MVAVFALLVAFALIVTAVLVLQEARSDRRALTEPIYVIDDAVRYVVGELSREQRDRLTADDVRHMLEWQLQYVTSQGPTTNGSGPRTPGSEPVVLGGTAAAAFIMARAQEAGRDWTFEDIHAVLDAETHYLRDIGGVGPPVRRPDEGDA